MRFSRFALITLVLPTAVEAATLVEDFTDISRCDLTVTTGVCNTIAGYARASAFAGSSATRPLLFGDGSDGVVDTSSGYTFDTDAKSVYQFRSLNITGGSVSVIGKRPLIIRSLGVVQISSAINIAGGPGDNGSTSDLITRPAGGGGGPGGGWGGSGGR